MEKEAENSLSPAHTPFEENVEEELARLKVFLLFKVKQADSNWAAGRE